MHVMKSKNCVTQYFALKDKILTLMDNLYSVLSFEKKVVQQNEVCYTVMYVLETILSNIYRIFNKKYEFEFFITKTHN